MSAIPEKKQTVSIVGDNGFLYNLGDDEVSSILIDDEFPKEEIMFSIPSLRDVVIEFEVKK